MGQKVDKKCFYYIKGRIKDQIETQNGERESRKYEEMGIK